MPINEIMRSADLSTIQADALCVRPQPVILGKPRDLRGDENRQSAFSDLAFREINHRFGNTLTLLAASLNRDFSHIASPELQAVLCRHVKQIVDFGQLHRLLALESGPQQGPMVLYFQALCSALDRCVLAPLNLKCEVFLAEGLLPTQQRAKLALVICELVMNCAKHAFPNKESGRVRIDIFSQYDVCGCIVSDDGVGLGSAPAGCGSVIIDAVVRELGGRIFTQSGDWGTTISVMFPSRQP